MDLDDIIPLRCPFTGIIIFDSAGYHEPFTETLLCYQLNDIYYELAGLEIIKEIDINIGDINYKKQKGGLKIYNNITKEFSWINTYLKNSHLRELISSHPLIKTVFDENDYGPREMNEGDSFSFYFAEIFNHHKILDDYNTILKDLHLR